jgi:hypothetical protein
MMMLQPRDLEIPTAALGLRETVENRAESSTMPLCHSANVPNATVPKRGVSWQIRFLP